MIKSKNIYLFYLGFLSTVTQILLLKELLISFYGNELSIGIILSVWLFWVAAGCFWGHKINKKIKTHEAIFISLITLLPLVTVGVIVLIKYSSYILNTPIGEYESVSTLALFIFLILSLNCFLVGYLFSLGASMPSKVNDKLWMSVNKAYAYEALGSVTGGLVFTFILNKILSPFQILLSFLFFVLLFFITLKTKGKTKLVSSLIVFVSACFLIRLITIPEDFLIKEHWKTINNAMSFIKTANTKYQNLGLLKLNDQYTLYSD